MLIKSLRYSCLSGQLQPSFPSWTAVVIFCCMNDVQASIRETRLILVLPRHSTRLIISCSREHGGILMQSLWWWYRSRWTTNFRLNPTSTQSHPTIHQLMCYEADGKFELTSSLYFMIVLFLALVSTHVTKSSNDLFTNIAGSVTGVGPTRICPCSIVRTAYSLATSRMNRWDVHLILSLPSLAL